MVMGVTSVIGIVSTVEGMQQNIEQVFKSLGTNTFIATRFGIITSAAEYLERRRRRPLTIDLIPRVEQGCPDCEMVGAETYAGEHLKRGSARMRYVDIEGHTPNILEMRNMEVEFGRYISGEDDHRRRNVAFIGWLVRDKLFPGEDPVGKKMRIGEREFTVIGSAVKVGESALIHGADEWVVIPISTHQKMFPQRGDPVNLIMSSVSQERREAAMDQVRVVLRTARRLEYEQEDDFTLLTPDAILSFINDFTVGFRVIMMALPLLSIVVGGIVIMNIMMISVTERTREIGIRKSLGASRAAILLQFLYEALILSLVGGLLGIVFGVRVGEAILTGVMEIDVTPTTLAIIMGFGISFGVGVFFGLFPALKASRLDPVEALGYE
jgi:putative ABC transport system permease protein